VRLQLAHAAAQPVQRHACSNNNNDNKGRPR
jgi:hypothetical protein